MENVFKLKAPNPLDDFATQNLVRYLILIYILLHTSLTYVTLVFYYCKKLNSVVAQLTELKPKITAADLFDINLTLYPVVCSVKKFFKQY